MSEENILLLARYDDPHTKGLIKELEMINESYIVIDSFLVSDSFTIITEKQLTEGIIKFRNEKIPIDKIKSVWNYAPLNIDINEKIAQESRLFVRAEWQEGFSSLWNALRAKWINDPQAISSSLNRLAQIQLASKLGLQVPKTLITNDPDTFMKFYNECNRKIVAKTLNSSRGIPEGKMIFTTKMNDVDISYARDLKYAPTMFQEYIPKSTEFRVTAIGKNLHSAEIHSQNNEKTKDDWRKYYDFNVTPYTKSLLPPEISNKLLKFMQHMNLVYGAIDLIKTPKGDFVFLEVNSRGRWWWIQELTGMNIAKDIAESLSGKKCIDE